MSDIPEEKFDPAEALAKMGIGMPAEVPAEEIFGEEEEDPGFITIPAPQPAPTPWNQPEAKPAGVNPKDLIGATKIDLSVVPPSAELHLATAMMDGAGKYGPFNWRSNPVLARVYVAAARRHLLQFLDGEDFDPISHVHHLGHAMACCAIVLDAYETGNLSDDRPLPGQAGNMIRRFDEQTKLSNG